MENIDNLNKEINEGINNTYYKLNKEQTEITCDSYNKTVDKLINALIQCSKHRTIQTISFLIGIVTILIIIVIAVYLFIITPIA